MSHSRFREIAFETNTTHVLDSINSHLINEPKNTLSNYTKRSGKTDFDLLHRLRVMLSVIDTADFTQDSNLDSVRYKINLCYALINYLERNDVMAKQFFKKVCTTEEGRSSVKPYENIMRSTGAKSSKSLRNNKRLQKKILVIGCISVVILLIAYPFITNFINSIGTISYNDATSHIGQSVKVKGKIVSTSYRDGTDFLDFCADYTHCPLALVVLHGNVSKFGDISKYSGNDVIVTGTVSSYQGRAEIILTDSSQIHLE